MMPKVVCQSLTCDIIIIVVVVVVVVAAVVVVVVIVIQYVCLLSQAFLPGT